MTNFTPGQLVKLGHGSTVVGTVVNVTGNDDHPQYYVSWDDGSYSLHNGRELVKAAISGPQMYKGWS